MMTSEVVGGNISIFSQIQLTVLQENKESVFIRGDE